MSVDVVIPSAKYIPSELQTIGKIPPVLYPLGSGTVFDYIHTQYCCESKTIKIIGFEGFSSIEKKILHKTYPNTILIKLSELGDLAHTVYYGLSDTNTNVIINFGDTIVEEDLSKLKNNSFYYSEECYSNLWTFFHEKNGTITEIVDKPSNTKNTIEKLFCGVFRLSNQKYFKTCLSEAFNIDSTRCSAFYVALLKYNERYPLTPIKTDCWYDIGHLDRYYSSKTKVKAREFNHISIDRDRGILRKTSTEIEKFIGEIQWYLKLPSDVEYCRPRIFTYSTNYNNPYVEMEYYSYHTVHELFLYGDLNYNQWKSVFEKIAFICTDFSRYTVRDTKIALALKEMYLDKSVARLEKLSENPVFEKMFESPITVNGITYKSLKGIIRVLSKEIPAKLYELKEFTIIHGDLCFTNMLIDDNYSFIKLIDPRGKFGAFDIYGDQRYDLAKLFHSVDGKYDYIIKNMFDLKFDKRFNKIDFTINTQQADFDLCELMHNVFAKEIGNQ